MTTKYPDITATIGDGNAFAIIGVVSRALRSNGVSKTEIDQFTEEATAGDYDNLLRTAMAWVRLTVD